MKASETHIIPDYGNIPGAESWSKNLKHEYRQCLDEGLDVEPLENLFSAISALPASSEKEKMCDALFSMLEKLPQREGYPYCEPNDISEIQKLRRAYPLDFKIRDIRDSMLGGWYGRICGCLLGKPVEWINSKELKTVCQMTGNYPLSRYIDKEELTEEIQNAVKFRLNKFVPSDCGYMPADDDTNYMLIALFVLKHYGRDFKSAFVAQTWLDTQPKSAYWTAERAAYRNFLNGYLPPDSASYKNPFREWIGAQIRGDVFGYVNPAKPEEAAAMAWTDARISHAKNGIYGEMWVAAMLAAAYGTENIPYIIKAGLAEIPATCRLYEAIEKICNEYSSGRSEEDTFKDIAARWNETDPFDWCHTISNAEIVAASLLYGNGDYGKSICMAVSQGFDTDCNGATVGSVLGVILGYSRLPSVWTDRIHGTLKSQLVGQSRVSVDECAEACLKYI